MYDDPVYHVDTFAYTHRNDEQLATPFVAHNISSKPNGTRRRGRSILQEVAMDVTPASITTRDPPEPDVYIRRVKSLVLDVNQLARNETNGLFTTPITKKDRLKIERELSLTVDDELDFEILAEFDDIEQANNYRFTSFREKAELQSHSCKHLLDQCQKVTEILDTLAIGFNHVGQETSELEQTCDALVVEQEHLSTLCKDIDENLEIFNRLENVTRQLHTPGFDLVKKTDKFKGLLLDLDEGLDYVLKHSKFKNIDLYEMRYRQCMTRVLTLAQSHFINQVKDIATQVQQQITAKMLNPATQYALLYSRFTTEAPRLKDITKEISLRCENHIEYYGLYGECLKSYLATRHRLLSPLLARNFEDSFKDPRKLVQLARSNLSFYKQTCQDEYDLFTNFFFDGDNSFQEWIGDICEPLYDVLRQRIIRETDINSLCELTSILLSYNEEEDQDNEDASEPAGHINYALLFRPILHDVQSRLVFRIQSYVQTEIVNYVPTPDDLSSLNSRRRRRKDKAKEIKEPGDEDRQRENESLKNGSAENGKEEETELYSTESLFRGWYPPMRKAIMLLSQIYQLVHSTVFDDLAHRIVHECIVSLQAAHTLAKTRLGTIEAHLFLIKHLITLRTQIVEFDIENVPAEIQVDFSGIQEVFTKVRQEGLDFSSANLLNIARASVPKVVNNMIDAKDELYASMKNAIHEFTEESVKSIISPIMGDAAADTAVHKTREMRQNATKEFPRIRQIIESYIEDARTTDILVDSIQDLVIQAYQKYHDNLLTVAKSAEDVDGIMEVDGLISWLGDIVGKLHTASRDSSIS